MAASQARKRGTGFDAVKFAVSPDRAKDDSYVDKKYEEVRASIQKGMDTLARRRRLPLFG